MKKIGFLMVLFIFSAKISGQNDLFPYNFNFEPYDFKIYNDSSLEKFNYSFQNKSGNDYFQNKNRFFQSGKNFSYPFNLMLSPKIKDEPNFRSTMPIYRPELYSNMPIHKPDLTVRYHMLIKKIEFSKSKANWLP